MPPSVKVAADLKSLIEQLNKVAEHSKKVSEQLEKTTEGVGDELANQTKKVETAFQKMSRVSKGIAGQLKNDMKALIGVNAVQSGLALNNMFRGQITKVASLNDAVRKLGAGFGISSQNFSKFQAKMMSGLGEIGLSAEDAARTMEGLAGSGVKGEENILGYSKIAGQLTSIGNEKGSEGNVAKGLSDVVRARGGNVQDMRQVDEVAREVTKAMDTTGASATKILDAMRETYQGASKSGRGMISLRGAAQTAIADQISGGNVSGLIKSMTSLPPEMRARAKAMGMTGIIGKGGELDIEGIKNMAKTMKAMGTSPELASQIISGNEEFGDTIMRLIDSADRLDEAFKANSQASDDFADKMKNRKGIREAGEAVINRAISPLSRAFSEASQGLTGALSKASESTAGSLLAVGGGALLSAALAGGGARSILGSIGGSIKGSAVQAVDKDVQKVFVVNAGEIGGGSGMIEAMAGGGLLSKAKGVMGKLGKGAGALGAGAAGYELGTFIGEKFDEQVKANPTGTAAKIDEKFYEAVKSLSQTLGLLPEIMVAKQRNRQDVNVTIQNKASQFETKSTLGRGKAQ